MLIKVKVPTKIVALKKKIRTTYTEKELLQDLTPHTAHAALLPKLSISEIDVVK